MYIKICGLQNAATVSVATDAGAHAVGFVFAPGSPRTISAELAHRLSRKVPQGVETVGVFRNQPFDEVLKTARVANLTTIQLHGNEPLDFILQLQQVGFKTLRAFTEAAYKALNPAEKLAWESQRILIDAVEPGAGLTFDTTALQAKPPTGFWLLAGGLTGLNVAHLIRTLKPTGVDVSSGVESSRGVKDATLIADFIQAVRSNSGNLNPAKDYHGN